MNPIVTVLQPDVVASSLASSNHGGGAVASQDEARDVNPQPFSSVFSKARNSGQHTPFSKAHGNRATVGNLQNGENPHEGDSNPSPSLVEGRRVPVPQVAATPLPSLSDALLLLELGDSDLVSKSFLGSLTGENLAQSSLTNGYSQESIEGHVGKVAGNYPGSSLRITTRVNHGKAVPETALGLLPSRSIFHSNLNGQGLEGLFSRASEANEEGLLTGSLRGQASAQRIGDSVVGGGDPQVRVLPAIQSFEGAARHSEFVLHSYGAGANSGSGLRANGMDSKGGNGVMKSNGGFDSGAIPKLGWLPADISIDEMASREFGFDQNEPHSKEFSSPSHQRAISQSGSGISSLFTESLERGSDKENLMGFRTNLAGERTPLPVSTLPQRLQVDVTLADDSRVQVEVAVQQRQVGAHIVTDQALLRNLVLQNEGQLVGQLAESGLELKQFEAHVFDHPAFRHPESQDRPSDRFSDGSEQEGISEQASRDRAAGMMIERGMHVVA